MTQVSTTSEPTAADDAGRFSTVAVNADFSQRDYATVCALLQAAPGAKLLDVSAASTISSDLFDALIAGWHAAPGSVPRLGVLMAFDQWALFRGMVGSQQLSRLASFGVTAELFYEEQARGGVLMAWFSRGEIVHNVVDVIESLRTRWRPSASWPVVLDAVSVLLRDHAHAEETAAKLFTEAAWIALSCRGFEQATWFAREALRRFDAAARSPGAKHCGPWRGVDRSRAGHRGTVAARRCNHCGCSGR